MCPCLNDSVRFLSQQLQSPLWQNQTSVWRSSEEATDLLNTLQPATHTTQSTPGNMLFVGGAVRWGAPHTGTCSQPQPPFSKTWILIICQQTLGNSHSTALGSEKTVKVPCRTPPPSPLNKGLSSSPPESDGVSTGALGRGWGWTGNIQKIENKNDLCKSSSGKPAFLVACIYNIKGKITNKAVNELGWIRSLFLGKPPPGKLSAGFPLTCGINLIEMALKCTRRPFSSQEARKSKKRWPHSWIPRGLAYERGNLSAVSMHSPQTGKEMRKWSPGGSWE